MVAKSRSNNRIKSTNSLIVPIHPQIVLEYAKLELDPEFSKYGETIAAKSASVLEIQTLVCWYHAATDSPRGPIVFPSELEGFEVFQNI